MAEQLAEHQARLLEQERIAEGARDRASPARRRERAQEPRARGGAALSALAAAARAARACRTSSSRSQCRPRPRWGATTTTSARSRRTAISCSRSATPPATAQPRPAPWSPSSRACSWRRGDGGLAGRLPAPRHRPGARHGAVADGDGAHGRAGSPARTLTFSSAGMPPALHFRAAHRRGRRDRCSPACRSGARADYRLLRAPARARSRRRRPADERRLSRSCPTRPASRSATSGRGRSSPPRVAASGRRRDRRGARACRRRLVGRRCRPAPAPSDDVTFLVLCARPDPA